MYSLVMFINDLKICQSPLLLRAQKTSGLQLTWYSTHSDVSRVYNTGPEEACTLQNSDETSRPTKTLAELSKVQ